MIGLGYLEKLNEDNKQKIKNSILKKVTLSFCSMFTSKMEINFLLKSFQSYLDTQNVEEIKNLHFLEYPIATFHKALFLLDWGLYILFFTPSQIKAKTNDFLFGWFLEEIQEHVSEEISDLIDFVLEKGEERGKSFLEIYETERILISYILENYYFQNAANERSENHEKKIVKLNDYRKS